MASLMRVFAPFTSVTLSLSAGGRHLRKNGRDLPARLRKPAPLKSFEAPTHWKDARPLFAALQD